MKDQADRLRQIVRNIREQKYKSNNKSTRVITVTSGKGGVGKTCFTVNFAICLGGMGFRVVIIDGDFGLSNVDVMLGITPRYDLSYFISGQKEFNEVAAEGPNGIRFISGGSGMRELVDISGWKLNQLLSRIERLDQEADIILIDTGAGISDSVIKMVLAADETILITTPDPTSIMDAYALAKSVIFENPNIKMRLIVNRADSVLEAQQILDKFSDTVRRFLDVELDKLGYISNDVHVSLSVKQQNPYILCYPKSSVSKQMRTIVDTFINPERCNDEKTGGFAAYIQKLLTAFK